MPTTLQETQQIVAICARHGVSAEQLGKIAVDLDEEVGRRTDNASVRDSFKLLRSLTAPSPAILAAPPELEPAAVVLTPLDPWELWQHWLKRGVLLGLFGLLWLAHMALVAANAAALWVLIERTDWWLWLPLGFCMVTAMSTPVKCPLVRLENCLRRQLGWPEINYFVGYYLYWPARKHVTAFCREFVRRIEDD
jgi:hypothetical protein